MSQLETKFKQKLVKAIREEGGYARRLEDQYAVGLPDMLVGYSGIGLCLIEVKVAQSIDASYGCSPRQLVEGNRVIAAGGRAMLLGITVDGSKMALSPPQTSARIKRECVRFPGEAFSAFMKRFIEGGN